jgi:hypothetical protein
MGQVIAPKKMVSLEPSVLIFNTFVVSARAMEKNIAENFEKYNLSLVNSAV